MGLDQHGRTIDYLRISVTERCNYRCVYCMPPEGIQLKPHEEMMTLEEIERLVAIATQLGFSRIRLTGGEPLVRLGICDLVGAISHMDGIEAVAMTTNGARLAGMAEDLRAAGLSRVNISLDTLDPEQFHAITRHGRLQDVLDGIDASLAVGFGPVKINSVVVRQLHQDVLAFARLSVDRPLHVRFIEYMPVGEAGPLGTGWTREDSVPSEELVETIDRLSVADGGPQLMRIGRESAPLTWGPASYFQFPGAAGTVGFISPLSRHFCAECNRLRVTADGRIRPCLFSDMEFDVLTPLRHGTDEQVREVLQAALGSKPDDHHDRVGTERGMSQIGG